MEFHARSQSINNLFQERNFQDMENIFLNQRSLFFLKSSIVLMIAIGFAIFLQKQGVPFPFLIAIPLVFLGIGFLSTYRKFELFPIWAEMVADRISKRIRYNPNASNIKEDFSELSLKYPTLIFPFGDGVAYKFDGIDIDDVKGSTGSRVEVAYINTRIPTKRMEITGKVRYKDLESFVFIGVKYGKHSDFLSRKLKGGEHLIFTANSSTEPVLCESKAKGLPTQDDIQKVSALFRRYPEINTIVFDREKFYVKMNTERKPSIFPETVSFLKNDGVKCTIREIYYSYDRFLSILSDFNVGKFWEDNSSVYIEK